MEPNLQVVELKTLPEATEGYTDCYVKASMNESVPGYSVQFPSRWTVVKYENTQQVKRELGKLAETVIAGTKAVVGVYMRMCDLVRSSGLTDQEVRDVLLPLFPPPRVSDILRVSRAPRDVYERYTAGFFSFKAAVERCRLYHITPTEELRSRKIRRAADRLVELMGGPGEICVKDRRVRVE